MRVMQNGVAPGMSPRIILFLPVLAFLNLAVTHGVDAAPAGASRYVEAHPRLAFARSEVPSLRQKLADGGRDDEAYAVIHGYVTDRYPLLSIEELMNTGYGLNLFLNIGLVTYLDQPPNEEARELGRQFVLALADGFAPDDNTFYAPIRLRSLCYGYDLCMDGATPDQRAYVRAEIESYVDSLMFAFNFERWLHPPYTSNITAMIGSSLGIAAICLADEMDPARVTAALDRADAFVETWMRYHLDPDGTCFEGVQYGMWALRHLSWYFEARRRHDGVDYSQRDDIRSVERWLAYEVLPQRGGAVNNINDTAYLNYPVARFNTYLEWAMSRWNSGLASWLWDRTLGEEDGHDWGELEDQPATVLWHSPIAPVNPATVLPRSFLWHERGLYYYRTGWPEQGSSDDLVFSFYSGIFHGGHSQEDQGSFTLFAYGSRFAADNGFERNNWASEAHNLVFINGKGQHFSGTSVGTDGRIAGRLLTPYADYLSGDATAAYGTRSPYNEPGIPFADDDWSYGYLHANPVEHARREWLVVHGTDIPPYFVLLDDVKKDDALHTYAWRMHADSTLDVNLAGPTLRIEGPRGALEIDVSHPADAALARSVQPFVNTSVDPNTNVISLTTQDTRGFFSLVLRPVGLAQTAPLVSTRSFSWGGVEVMAWPGGITDVVLANAEPDTIATTVSIPGEGALLIRTDARIAHLRRSPGATDRWVLVRATSCDAGSVPVLRSSNGAVTAVIAGAEAFIDRADAVIRLHAPGVRELHGGGKALRFARQGAFISTPAARTPQGTRALRAYPQPAKGAATIVLESDATATVTIDVFDVAGRRVRTLQGMTAPGTTEIPFDGLDNLAQPLGSGVYFLRARGGGRTTTARFVLVR
jgi:hypothetical protein